MTLKYNINPPRSLKHRLKAVAKNHGFGGVDAVIEHFIARGLSHYETPKRTGDLGTRLNAVVVDQGYSSIDELVEHLLQRGLQAYEDAPNDPEQLKARLRGLGYIE